jgi:hypothetical protein
VLAQPVSASAPDRMPPSVPQNSSKANAPGEQEAAGFATILKGVADGEEPESIKDRQTEIEEAKEETPQSSLSSIDVPQQPSAPLLFSFNMPAFVRAELDGDLTHGDEALSTDAAPKVLSSKPGLTATVADWWSSSITSETASVTASVALSAAGEATPMPSAESFLNAVGLTEVDLKEADDPAAVEADSQRTGAVIAQEMALAGYNVPAPLNVATPQMIGSKETLGSNTGGAQNQAPSLPPELAALTAQATRTATAPPTTVAFASRILAAEPESASKPPSIPALAVGSVSSAVAPAQTTSHLVAEPSLERQSGSALETTESLTNVTGKVATVPPGEAAASLQQQNGSSSQNQEAPNEHAATAGLEPIPTAPEHASQFTLNTEARTAGTTAPLRTNTASAPQSIPSTTAVEPASKADATPTSPVRDMTLQLGGTAPHERIDVRLTERAGELHVTVRANSPEVVSNLRENLPDLVTNLKTHGFESSTWTGTSSEAESDRFDTQRMTNSDNASSSDSEARQFAQTASEDAQGRKRQRQHVSNWEDRIWQQ